MALEDELNGHNDIAQFLEKFKEAPFPQDTARPAAPSQEPVAPPRPAQYARSFEKLEQKIHELEERFEASTTQNQLILSELARTREVMERQRDKDAFLEHLSRTIATLRTSVENLSQAQQTQSFAFREAPVQRSFDPLPTVFAPTDVGAGNAYAVEQEMNQLRRQRDEQERLFNSLRQKASQLKAVNSALDREIKRTQQEKMDALKKSADQAKEILSLRDQLSAAEERFKSFDFEGRIISIKKEYQQKVTSLETQLKAMSDTCMKQVEEIESLKAENTKLQKATAEKEALQAQLADKEQQLKALKNTIASLQAKETNQQAQQLAAFTAQLRTLEEQRDRLAVELEQSQITLETIRREKDLLEKNFKELVVKMNNNDAVIGQLRQKIDVLGRQNEELSQSNNILTQDNAALSRSNVELTHRNAALTQHNATLTRQSAQLEAEKTTLSRQAQQLGAEKKELAQHVDQLNRTNQALGNERKTLTIRLKKLNEEKEELSQNNQTLSIERVQLEKKAYALEAEKKDLSEKNEQLRTQSAALLAARVVQEHAQKDAQKTGAKTSAVGSGESLHRPEAPVLHSLGRTIARPNKDEDWEVIRSKQTQPPAPEQTHVQSEEDLPEIKVAQPVPQDEMFDGDDFLTKTDTFIGRMKWSIFRENR